MKITANRHPKEQNHVITSGFSFKKIKEKIAAIIGTKLIMISAFATSVFASAITKVTLAPRTNSALMMPGTPILIKSSKAL